LESGYETKPAGQDRIDRRRKKRAGRIPTDIRPRHPAGRGPSPTGLQTPRAPPHRFREPSRSLTTPRGMGKTIIAEFVHEGRFDTINFVPQHEDVEQLTRFATEVIPAACAAIAEYGQHE